jgi:REP element-mobilizing transposase RayT
VTRVFWAYKRPRNFRLDAALYEAVGQSCSFTVRAAPGTKPFADPTFADIAVACLLEQRQKSNCDVNVYCVMPDHIHVVVTPVVAGASSLTFIDRFKGACSRQLHLAGWKGPIWQKRSYDHLVRDEEELQALATYILGNPVRGGLVEQVEDYRWSGIPERIQPSM